MVAGRDPSVLVGGVPNDIGRGFRLGRGEEFVIEGDEYDSAFFDKGSKFLHYAPRTAVLTSVELDHVDIFSSMEEVRSTFRKFVELLPETGFLAVCARSEEALAIAGEASCKVERYAVHGDRREDDTDAEWVATGVDDLGSGRCHFEVYYQGELYDHYETVLTGVHNLENITACIAVAHSLGIERGSLRAAITSFSGVARRQQFRGIAQGVTVVDDYGHHPTAIAETLQGLHRRYPGRRLIALYEPRTATSRRKTFQHEFADAFAHADELVVGALFDPERIPREERFDPERLALEVHQSGTPATHIADVDKIIDHVVESARPGDVVIVFSSGSFGGIHDKLLHALGDAIIPATRDHVEPTRALLQKLSLDYQDIDEGTIANFYVLENETGFAGCVGLEVFGEDAVLRSLAVSPSGRGVGYGWMLADLVIHRARYRGVRHLYLVTEHASDFFAAKHGFRMVDLSTAPRTVRESPTFRRRSSALVPMRLDL
jgi:UDP-N-acetylmuramate: L-alanyl-gamma-D-glutamyl-meso-diaminopimelate ligase